MLKCFQFCVDKSGDWILLKSQMNLESTGVCKNLQFKMGEFLNLNFDA